MPDSTWRKRLTTLAFITLAAITAASIVYVHSQKAVVDRSYQDYQRNSADHQQRATNKAAENCKGIVARERFFECAVNQLQAYARQDNSNQDLKAQQDMAFWAEWLFYVTVVFGVAGVALTLIGIKYVKDTLLETRRLGRAEIRAYLACEGGEFKFTDKSIRLSVVVKNTGNSPTSPIEFSCTANIYNGDLFNKNEFKSIDTVRFDSGYPMSAIAPNTVETIFIKMSDAFPVGESYKVRIRQQKIMFFVVLRWVDVFDEEQMTSFNMLPVDTFRLGDTGVMGQLQAFNHAGKFHIPPYGPAENMTSQ